MKRASVVDVPPQAAVRTVEQMSVTDLIHELVGGSGNGQFQDFDYLWRDPWVNLVPRDEKGRPLS